jgi:hypothetical protein
VYIINRTNEDSIKKQYRNLVRQYHPDINPNIDHSIMAEINAEYEKALTDLYAGKGWDSSKIDWKIDLDIEIVKKVMEIQKVSHNLDIEICGVWAWITGDTRTYKDALKALGCRWCPQKNKWAWHRPQDKKTWRSKPVDMMTIRWKYGSVDVNKEREENNIVVKSR